MENKEKDLSFTMEVFNYLKRQNKRLLITIIIMAVLIATTAIGISSTFIWYLNQFEVVDEIQTEESIDIQGGKDGNANYIGGNGYIEN
jgi:hypothetical protein